ncbi:AbrB/MazE/SpoVT family DNA-binding domain-containing protein [Paenibacillus gallinarum]|uniref:AbrB/MazE/SpoVT family DNA-binding domain-containing protein n=1 Tax=Paenibacillus gallinarum TaxID=2762232 RepID=A0ABR8T3N6_9BACL|nr:AbrB/MazE/SpoVT family DNA-binding domain-containing protein [Paenibacillus gallinarum]MBD7970371.1 AbrB/MazE/SpoVT family DNA-binding domain-containing protein [Paenibacillus gallinarum]
MRRHKNTGIVRNVDSLGRIVLPKELRDILGIEIGDPLEYFIDDANERLTVRTYRTMECMFCSTTTGLVYFKDYFICGPCVKQVPGSGNEKLPERVASLQKTSTKKELDNIKLKQNRSKKTLVRLIEVMKENPDSSQKKWAELSGISQGRVSQLVQILNELDRQSS